MRIKETKVYKFSELSDKAKARAIEKLSDINVHFDWWDSTYEDAARVGIKITGFDIDLGAYCEGEIPDTEETAHKIISEHGEACETHKTARAYLEARDKLISEAKENAGGDWDESALDSSLDELGEEFKKSILEDYRIILSKEYDYQTSDDAIRESIEANEYEFDENGNQE